MLELRLLTRLEEKKARLDALRPLPEAAVRRLREQLIMEWIYNSNAIEGNTLTLQETKLILETGLTIGGKSLREHFEVLNHKEAIDYVESLVADRSPVTPFHVRQIHELNPNTGVELLAPDFNAIPEQLAEVFESRPEVFAHNVETVPRIFKRIRPAFRYERSLAVLTAAHDDGLVTKSNLILGMGETPAEVRTALVDLQEAGCDIITITQYLRPSPRHHPVDRWVTPEEFVEFAEFAEGLGFAGVLAGPLVRSSYRAGRLYAQAARLKWAATPPVS